jgi:predicted aminopeptidase
MKPPGTERTSPQAPPWGRRVPALLAGIGLVLLGSTMAGCSVSYYAQAVAGEASMMFASRPVADWLADPATPEELRRRLQLAARIRAFASQRLGLPDNRSYKRYADLHRSSALWNVFAAPPLSLTLKTWCYPLLGCAGYRGYFSQDAAQDLARALALTGLDTHVAPVPAYSTLGWLPDPLLSTFIQWPEPELARLIFHELAHQVLYVRDDTRFNESFATAVERAGLQRWVAERDDPALREQYAQYRLRHDDLLQLVEETHRALQALYDSAMTGAAPGTADPRLAQKQQLLAQLPLRYARLRDERWNGFRGYDAYFEAPWNNARIAALAAYNDDVPAFEALLAQEGGDLPRFFVAVKKLAALEPQARAAALRELAASAAPGAPLPANPPIEPTGSTTAPTAAMTAVPSSEGPAGGFTRG